MSAENKGTVRISEDVVTSLAAAAVTDIKGVEKIRPKYSSIRRFLKNDKPLEVRVTSDVIEINTDVILKYGYNAVSVCEKIQESVKSEIQAVTGITVSKVNVTVSGIIFDRK